MNANNVKQSQMLRLNKLFCKYTNSIYLSVNLREIYQI